MKYLPKGEPNPYGKYFIGQSYLADVGGGVMNVTFEPRCRNNTLINYKSKVAQHAFCEFFIVVASLAALMGIIALFTRIFGIKPLGFLSSLSLVGLAYVPMVAMRLLAFINTKIYIALDINFFSISSIFTQVATIFLILCVYDYAINNKENKSKATCLWFTLATFATYYFADSFASWMFTKLFL